MQSLKEKFRTLIQSKTAKDVIGEKFKLIDIGSQNTVLEALEKLQKNNVSSLPVFFENTKKYFASISLQDLAVVIFVLAMSKSFVDLFAEKIIEWRDFDNEDFKVFSNGHVEEFCNASERNNWSVISINTPILEIMKILSNPAQNENNKSTNVTRVGIENEKGEVVGVISQYGLLSFLIEQLKQSKLFEDSKVNEVLSLQKQNIFTIKENDIAYEGFRMMLENKISGVGVINEKDQLVSLFSSFDLKRDSLSDELFSDLRLPIKEYLCKSKRYFDKEINENAIVMRNDDSFVSVLDKIQKYHLHQIFSVDENKVPLNVVSLCDIIGALLN